MPEMITELEKLVIEWRNARQEWFDLEWEEMQKVMKDKVNVLRRCGNAEQALMECARAKL